ncbi:mycofactocin biosynthesis glycosyltransferase MftF [Nocardioides nitrophenolicus]|uniref:mycofactocin biosynthesis glycosyltransferase MftF n=1 Tax=Nocardioides nitrophenolicus TaxID=60489 RepID=UPI00195C3CB4|nr:mycofactocin biosynthesis glycosyltransferase MftF [Nocardioides nitrophenolicus]MBM7515694.1 mycofactocin system glycosyltransferase [Nocardioides nitrophenolicus]
MEPARSTWPELGASRDLPPGTTVRLLASTWRGEGGRALFGGAPSRMLFLSPAAVGLLAGAELVVDAPPSARLARMLLDRGLAEVDGGRVPWRLDDVTVVVPVKDRPESLARLLGALRGLRVVVVDDGSTDPDATAAVAAHQGAELVRHPVCRGPAAARNTGLRAVRTELVAFVDSDVVPTTGWLGPLLLQLTDPAVGVVAPRIAGLGDGRGRVARYEAVRSSLDLGAVGALVVPGGPVPYVPSACLVGRVGAFGEGFDERMRVGEDVDLVWRTVRDGWAVRYVPEAVVAHEHRAAPRAWLARKAFYGTSAAPLALRHGDAVAPVVAGPLTVAVALVLVVQRPWALGVAAGVGAGVVARTAGAMGASERPWGVAIRLAPYGVAAAAQQCAAAMNRHWWPLMVPAALLSRRARRAWLAGAVLDGLVEWVRSRPDLDLSTYLVLRRLDDLSYGAGLWWGAVQHTTTAPLRPAVPFLHRVRRGSARRAEARARRWPATSRRGRGRPRR